MCQKSVRKIDQFLLKKNDQLIPCSKNQDILKEVKIYNSWIVEKNGVRKYGFDAFIVVISNSTFFWPLKYVLNTFPFKQLGKKIYKNISKNRITNL